MNSNIKIGKKVHNIPQPIHLWEVEGFVKLSTKARNKFEKLIKKYGMCKLAKDLGYDKETIYSIYSSGRKKGAHSIRHLLKIAAHLNYDLSFLEREVTHYGGKQNPMYPLTFPFVINPLYIRAVAIHGDGSHNKINKLTCYYQQQQDIHYMEDLIGSLFKSNVIDARRKNEIISYITIPSILVKLVCKSINLDFNKFHSKEFFNKIIQLPIEYQFQVFAQFIVDECHFKDTTFTVSQKTQEFRKGFLELLKSLDFDHLEPKNNRHDITIYAYNYPRILDYLNNAVSKYGNLAGFWFKEERFRDICKRSKPENSLKIIKNRKINTFIFNRLRENARIFSLADIRKFNRNHAQARKAVTGWKKNGLVKRINRAKYKFI